MEQQAEQRASVYGANIIVQNTGMGDERRARSTQFFNSTGNDFNNSHNISLENNTESKSTILAADDSIYDNT